MNVTKPRVLIFSLAYFPLVGGAEIAVKEITDRLGSPTHSGVGVDFDLITLRFEKGHESQEVMGNVTVYRVDGGKLFFPITALLLAGKLHRQNHYQVCWSIMAAYAGFGVLFFKLFNPRIPMLLTLQEGDSEKHILNRVGVFYPFWRLIFKKADYIQAISKYLAGFARRHGAVCPIEVVPNGVSLDKFEIPNPKSETNSKFQTSSKLQAPSSKTIITTSRLVYKNGIDTLIRAVALLKAKSYKLKAVIVGDGPDTQKLKDLSCQLKIDDIVKFIGHVDPDLIPHYLAQADIFVRPSRSEGLGNSFLEAMAAGLPVIGTPVGGIPEFITDGETGLFCKVDNAKDLAEKIIKVLSDAKLSQKLSENGRKLVESGYSWSCITEKMVHIFNQLTTPRLLESESRSQRLELGTKAYNLKLKTKILLATGIYPPEIGGPATYAALLEKELPRRGIGVTVLPFRTVRNWPVGIRHFFYFIKTLHLAWRHDFILAQDTISVGLPSLLAAKLLGKQFLIRVPGDYVWEQSTQRFGIKDSIDDFQNKRYGFKVEFFRRIQKFVVNQADVVITPSKYFQQLVSGWIKNPGKVKVIYNGIDLKISNSQFLISKQTLNSKPQTLKTIISAGRLVPWKGFGFLVELMKDLPEWKLVIAGDGPEREALKLQVISYKLQDRVELLGQIPRKDLMQKISEADIFILNTLFESFSFQIVEAMSLGVPVVATNIGNLAEIIENNIDGILVEPNNKEEFLSAINKLDKDENFRQNIAEKAKIKAQKFSINNTIESLVDLFNQKNGSR